MTFLHMYRVSLPISVDLPLILVCRLPVAATTAALYDHALGFGQEVDLIWRTPPSFAAVLYIIDRYVGNAVLLAGVYLCFAGSISQEEYVT
ncbi:hypothetical protein SCLCIDRAFT_1207354 [Scleroderma citrinum Foug A]|uniref:DUF6533 domain-containing protein n=1 Tax=Scleroderma citrinum Foug A TaxID=1036808 RepID=A0A0C3EQG2_9AGAM|nr:hypothetical protein SCLCIDRAFT_1207354 [Scleroderma citrinum Foug A]